MKMYYVYVLKLENKQNYIGFTSNLKKRLEYHKKGTCKTTRRIKPKKVIFYCAFQNKNKAKEFEKYLKSGSGTAFRHKHLE
jgi:putative endonuclease